MKKFFLYITSLILITAACKQMDSEYKNFIEPNGIVYLQKADSLKIYPGYYKLRLEWLKPKFPGVKYSVVYWNNYSDSLKVNFPENSDTIKLDLPNLEETSYSFNVINFDGEGHKSIPVEATGTPYGDGYLLSSTNRSYVSATRNIQNTGTIIWGAKTTDLVYTEVRYQTIDNTNKTVRIGPTETTLSCPRIKPGEKFQYRSFFLPKSAIDTASKEWLTSEKPFMYDYPRTTWTIESRNGSHAWGTYGGQPSLVFDGDMNTGFHSTAAPLAPLPQCLAIDMKESLIIDNIVITLPTTVSWRYIQNVEVYFSDNPIVPNAPQPSWGPPVATATYLSGDTFKIQLPEPKSARYVAIVFPNSKSNTYISFMELNILGY